MLFNLNEFLMAVSRALDFVEIDIIGVTSNHSKRTAYISLRIAKKLGLGIEQLHDIVALGILHDNGASEKGLHDRLLKNKNELINFKSFERIKEHCIIGERNIREYPFLTDVTNVLKYHHESYNGTGFFHLRGEEIPLLSQIIAISDTIDRRFHLEENDITMQEEIINFVEENRDKLFSMRLVDAFIEAAQDESLWRNLKNDRLEKALRYEPPQYRMELPVDEIRKITGVLSRIIDCKSEYTQRHSSDLSEKVEIMADYYKMSHEEKLKLIIAADLHDIGKLAVPNSILDSPKKLTKEEFKEIKKHPYFTRLALRDITGFEDITKWASNHHEKLNGKGYPSGKRAKDLDFNARLIACLDIYEALTENRPYRKALSHVVAMNILNNMRDNGFIDARITNDINYVFSRLA
ncbi:HD-GYP domain-containing protein [Clostridium felsineum]|uniref:HD-GYP domain-containing protein n=1 Tax=Clostridium felsineum TaxID=36839 RepID=UPI00098C6128|nr:HD-GYP domain-containing protein [Clostridium felsineum]URZ04336.1 3'3'-cGAMP-specific phosphodiesterase 1 [Clostridium felsineum]